MSLVLAEALRLDSTLVLTLAVVTLLALVLMRRARRPRPPAELPEKPITTAADLKVARAQAELQRTRQQQDEARAQAATEQEERLAKAESARAAAEEEARFRAETEQLLAERRREAREAVTDEERRAAQEEIARLEAEARSHDREAAQARRRAAFEEKKAREAARKTQRQADEDARRLEALAREQAAAEEEARLERERLRRAEAQSGRTLADGLQRTRGGFMARIAQLVGASATIDERFLGELEEILFTADIGVRTADKLMALVRDRLKRKELADPSRVRAALREEMERILTLDGKQPKGGMPAFDARPAVVMIVGVNGSGKTTSLGKLAFQQRVEGRRVLLGAGDTFRAAAAEQLDVWAARAEVEIVKGPADSDPGAVCFDAVKRSVDDGYDLCLLDTAGRLHTKVGLMDELKKVRRVIDKALPGAPHETWLVIDGTTGQNGLEQARQFHEALGLTGVVLTKLDGTAKGGIVLGICDQLQLPVRYIGVGEKIGDLQPFDPRGFVDALFADQ